jgi:dTDP-4-amino-4,6-dideoxygalactose transaminase
MIRIKPISIALSPNVQKDDVWLAIKVLLTSPPGGEVVLNLEQKFKKYLSAKYAFSLNSGRSALYVILNALNLKVGEEVLLQAFTCNAVPNPVLWAGGKPVYVDIDDSLNIDPENLLKRITPRARAIIIQNTFGVPAQIDKILEIARRYNIIVIEDCAHALGAEFNGKKLGTFGDVAFFSFGRDKVISSVWGGVVTTNNDEIARSINEIYKNVPYPKKSWVIKQLLHPILFFIIIPTYYIFGKYLLAFLRVARGIGLAVSKQEKNGERPEMFPAKMPDELAVLALHQFNKLEKYNAHRREIAKIYYQELSNSSQSVLSSPPSLRVREGAGGESYGAIYLRFNVRHPNAKEIIAQAKKRHILLGDWYKNVIDPVGTNFEKLGYTPGSCPKAERAALESINLPTHINISVKDAEHIIQYLGNYR